MALNVIVLVMPFFMSLALYPLGSRFVSITACSAALLGGLTNTSNLIWLKPSSHSPRPPPPICLSYNLPSSGNATPFFQLFSTSNTVKAGSPLEALHDLALWGDFLSSLPLTFHTQLAPVTLASSSCQAHSHIGSILAVPPHAFFPQIVS